MDRCGCRIRHVAPARTRSPERARDLLRALCQNFSAISEIPVCVPAPPGVFLPVKRHRGEPGHTRDTRRTRGRTKAHRRISQPTKPTNNTHPARQRDDRSRGRLNSRKPEAVGSLKRSAGGECKGAFFSGNRARLRMPRCSRSGRLGRGRPLRIRSDRLPLSDMASRACSKPVGAMYARGAGPSTPSLDQRERVGHYREQAVASPRLRSPFTPMVSESHQANHRHAPSEHLRNRIRTPGHSDARPSGGARFVDVELDMSMMRSVRRAKRDTPDQTAL